MSARKENVSEPIILTTITDEHIINLDLLCSRFETNLVLGMKKTHVKKIIEEHGENKFKCPKKMFSLDNNGLKERKEKQGKFSKAEWKRIFGQHLPREVTVIRDGVRINEVAKNIVVGDLIELETNEIVPADIRLIWAKHLIVDNRLITGNICEKRTHFLQNATGDPILSPNMIFACTRIISGHCLGVALRTGEGTVFGTLKKFAQKVKVRKKRSNTSCVSTLSGGSSSEFQSNSCSDLSSRTLSEWDVTSNCSKTSGKTLTKKRSTSSSISTSSSEPDTTSEEGSISGKYQPRGLTRARSVFHVLEDLGEVSENSTDHSSTSRPGGSYSF